MPGDPLRKVSSGETFEPSAGAWNAFVEAARKVRGFVSTGVSLSRLDREPDIILVRNDSGEDVDRFGVLALDEPLISPEDNESEFTGRIAFSGVLPAPQHSGRYAVLLEPLRHEDEEDKRPLGRAVVDGFCIAWVDVKHADHRWAEVDDGKTKLKTAAGGSAKILWHEPYDSGEVWAIVRLNSVAEKLWGTLAATLTPGGSVLMNVRDDDTNQMTVYDLLLSAGQSIDAGMKVTAYYDSEDAVWYVDAAQCPTGTGGGGGR